MSGPLGSSQWMYASGDFTIDQSLRFNNDDSAYLSRTPASASNQKTWTFSCWAKYNTAGRGIFGAGGGTSNRLDCGWEADGSLNFFMDGRDDGSSYYANHTTALFRDESAWYHLVFAFDTTQETAANRMKTYVNGSQITEFQTETNPDRNTDWYVNSTDVHSIGDGHHSALDQYYDGYMAEVHFIDGTALTPASFGETGDYGEWKPKEYVVADYAAYGTNGFYLSFAGGGTMSATGGDSITTDGDYKYNTFLSDGTFTPSSITGDGHVEYLVIAGGGGGGHTYYGGGGGAGGYKTGMLSVTAQAYAITVGDGGAQHTQGDNSSIASEVVSTGGGAGGNTTDSTGEAGGTGGSGGGGGNASGAGGSGTTGQGNDGGTAPAINYSAGGGGAGTAGSDNVGGNGLASSITGSSVTRAGGGGGGYHVGYGSGGTGGSGGGGQGGEVNDLVESGNGTPNTGSGGGGGGANDEDAGSGGSGIVIIRYKFQ